MGAVIRVSIVPHWFANIESWYVTNFNALVSGKCSIRALVKYHHTALTREYSWQVMGDILLSVSVVLLLLAYTYLWVRRARPVGEELPR